MKKIVLLETICIAGIIFLMNFCLNSHFGRGSLTRDVGWEARQNHWKDSSKKMFWKIFNDTDKTFIIYSDTHKVQLKPEQYAELPRQADFTIEFKTKNGSRKKISTRQHFIKISIKNGKLKLNPSRVRPK